MIDRQEVEALLSEATNPRTEYQVQTSISLATLAALCRAWLAVQDAPEVEVTACNQVEGAADFDHGDMSAAIAGMQPGQRVRIVKEGGES